MNTDQPRVTLLPDTPDHHAAHRAAVRAKDAGYRPVLTADEQGRIVVLVAFTADELDQLLDAAQIAENMRQDGIVRDGR